MNEISKRIVWAVDPFAEDLNSHVGVIALLNLVSVPGTEIQPLYVWTGGIPEGVEGTPDQIQMELRNRADQLLGKWAKPDLIGNLRRIEVLERPLMGTGESANTVVEYARRTRSPLIVVGHHHVKGFQRWLLGSFAESLSLISEVSVLCAPPEWHPLQVPKRIFFPTDFSAASQEAFESVVEFAKDRGFEVTLFHKVKYPPPAATELSFASANVFSVEDLDLVDQATLKVDSMVASAAEKQVKANLMIDDRKTEGVGESILQHATTDHQIIALAAHGGAARRALIGTTSRFLLREAKIPVWVLRPVRRRSVQRARTVGAPDHRTDLII